MFDQTGKTFLQEDIKTVVIHKRQYFHLHTNSKHFHEAFSRACKQVDLTTNIGRKEKEKNVASWPIEEAIMIFTRIPPAETEGKLFLSNKTHFPSECKRRWGRLSLVTEVLVCE